MTPRQQELMKLLVSKGLHVNGAAAVVGNCSQEVGINLPTTFTLVTDHGSQGLAQWRLERLTALEAFAVENKLSVIDLNTQGLFLLKELATDYPSLDAMMRQPGTRSIANLTANFMTVFERPSFNPAINKLDFRIQQAAICAKDYVQAGPGPMQPGDPAIIVTTVGGIGTTIAMGINSGLGAALETTAIVSILILLVVWYAEHRQKLSAASVAPANATPLPNAVIELRSALEELKLANARVMAAKAVFQVNRQEEDAVLEQLNKMGGP